MARLSALVLVVLTLLAAAPVARASRPWRSPVDGPVTRGFDLGSDPFAPGRHRGADFGAPPGATVRSACSGRVVVARRVGTSGRVVTVRCGPWRATLMPLATLAVRAGDTVGRGTPVGTLAPSAAHDGLHLGARREGSRFGYADPLTLIGTEHHSPPPQVVPIRARRVPPPAPARHPAPAPLSHRSAPAPLSRRPAPASLSRRPAPAPLSRRPAPVSHGPAPRVQRFPARPAPAHSAPGSSPVAPWSAWAGLAVLLAGAVGSGVRFRVAMRRAPVPGGVAREVP